MRCIEVVRHRVPQFFDTCKHNNDFFSLQIYHIYIECTVFRGVHCNKSMYFIWFSLNWQFIDTFKCSENKVLFKRSPETYLYVLLANVEKKKETVWPTEYNFDNVGNMEIQPHDICAVSQHGTRRYIRHCVLVTMSVRFGRRIQSRVWMSNEWMKIGMFNYHIYLLRTISFKQLGFP